MGKKSRSRRGVGDTSRVSRKQNRKQKPPRHTDPVPYEVDDVKVVGALSIVWLIAGLAMLPFWDTFKRDGHLWWVATAFSGAALGLVGMQVALRRRSALRRMSSSS